MLPEHNQSSLYCFENSTGLICPPIKLPQFAGSQRHTSNSNEMQPPIARQIPYSHTYHGENYTDEYHWLRDDKRENKDVISHLNAENKYSKSLLSPLKHMQDKIFKEITGRKAEDDETYPQVIGDYGYYQKTVKGLQYPIRCRKRIDKGASAKEEVLLDLNTFKEEQLAVGGFEVSPNQKLLAYTLDTTGSESYSLFIKDLEKGTVSEEVKEVTGTICWSNEGQHLYYIKYDDIFRPSRLFRHKLGKQQSSDEELYTEEDQEFYVGFERSLSQKYLFVVTGKFTSYEMYYLDLDNPASPLELFSAREEDRIYNIEHQGNDFLMWTNRHNGKKYSNYHVLRIPISQATKATNWTEVVPYDEKHYISNIYPLEKYIVLAERVGGYTQLRVIDTSSAKDNGQIIKFPEPIFTVSAKREYWNYNSTEFFFEYSSFTTPGSLFKYDLATGSRTLLKTDSVLGNFDSKKYVSERVIAPNHVPISLVYRKDLFKKDGSNPLHLNGYGSYGVSYDPKFSASAVSLLDRGFVYAIAHVRGGSEKGYQWYEKQGKLLKKRNTFRDFSNAARYLVTKNYTSPGKLSIEGRSAGGLLVGAAINLNPGLFNAAIMDVPFVDVINTMMDPTIPLTVGHYGELGNPNSENFFKYMMSYSPYDNLPKTGEGLPHLLVRSGFNDLRTQYWESAKYVAKLRDIIAKSPGPSKRYIAQIINMEGGHFGSSGANDKSKDEAQNYAFLVAAAKQKKIFL